MKVWEAGPPPIRSGILLDLAQVGIADDPAGEEGGSGLEIRRILQAVRRRVIFPDRDILQPDGGELVVDRAAQRGGDRRSAEVDCQPVGAR